MLAAQRPVPNDRSGMQAGAAVPTRAAMLTLTKVAPGLSLVLCAGECVAAVQQRVRSPGCSLPV